MAIAFSEKSHEISGTGAFVRQSNHFATPFGKGTGELPVEAGRYRLIWAPICPWAHRQIITFRLLGLNNTISVGRVHRDADPSFSPPVISVGTTSPVRTAKGWEKLG